MKLLCTVIILLGCASLLWADEQTLFGNEKLESGGYGALATKFTQIDGRFAVMVGGQGAWIVNHTFALGAGGYGLATRHEPNQDVVPRYWQGERLTMGYFGIIFSYIASSNSLTHSTFDLLIGGGSLSLEHQSHHYYNDDNYDHESYGSDAFFVLEPSLNGELNVAKFMRIAGGIGYRFVGGVQNLGYSNSDIAGPTGSIVFKFGKF